MNFRTILQTHIGIGSAVGALSALLVLLLWWGNVFVGTRLGLGDLFYVMSPAPDNIVLVGIGDETLSEYGALTGWDRSRYADATDALTEAGARVIAFDILFADERPGDAAFAAALERASANGTRTVIGVSGVERVPTTDEPNFVYRRELPPVETLADAADHLAYVNAVTDADGTVRTILSFGESGEDRRPSFALATYLANFRVSASLVDSVVSVEDDKMTLPSGTDIRLRDDGLWYPNFYGATAIDDTFSIIPFNEIEDMPPETFEDKIVIIGLTDVTGAVDLYMAPTNRFGTLMPGVEIQAHAVASLLDGKSLLPQSMTSQIITIVVLAFITALLCAYLHWYGMLAAGAVIIFGWGLFASMRFSTAGIIPNALHPLIVVFFATLGSIGARVSLEVLNRRRVESQLKSLQNISEQRLELSRIIPLMEADIRGISDAEIGGIWILEEGHLEPHALWGGLKDEGLHQLAFRAYLRQDTQIEKDYTAIPIVWQGNVIGVIIMAGEQAGGVARVERFAERVAAILDNTLLYRQTQEQNQLLISVLAESPAGILVLDSQLNLLRCNEAASIWLELDSSQAIGQPVSFLLESSPLDEGVWRTIGNRLTARTSFRMELKIEDRTFQLDAAHIPGDGRWVITMGDISDLAELNRLKTQMIRMASHDLKNPLGRIIGYSELIEEFSADGEYAEQFSGFTDRIIRSAEEMMSIISDILDLEHIRSGNTSHEPVDLLNVVRDVIGRHNDDIRDRNQTLHTDLPDSLATLEGDYNQLVQSVSNLLGNAIKYTPDNGDIYLRILEQGDKIHLEVEDNGYGMPKDAQEKLFTEFYRVRTQKTMNIQGTGLGLSLVKSVVEAHGGDIWVESELDKGSTFYVDLPLPEAQAEVKPIGA